ncbi:MAG: peptidase, partial [Rhodospirillales bacterium]|nr:peptidase [Rhodospirillales bacterium]
MGPHAAHRFARRHFIAGLAGVCGGAHVFATDDPNAETLRSHRAEAMAGAPDALGRFIVPVWLNGRGPYRFPIDTAAGRSVIASDIAHQLALPPADEARLHGIAGAESCPTVHLRELSLGPLRSTNLEPLLLPRARLQVDGLLGLDVLEDRCAALDFTSHTLTVSRGRWGALGPLRRPGETVVSGISRLGQLTFADCKADGARVYGFIDSGAQVSVGNEALA